MALVQICAKRLKYACLRGDSPIFGTLASFCRHRNRATRGKSLGLVLCGAAPAINHPSVVHTASANSVRTLSRSGAGHMHAVT